MYIAIYVCTSKQERGRKGAGKYRYFAPLLSGELMLRLLQVT